MITITIDLLDALLSADHEKRTYGEAYLKSLTVEERCGSLLQFLTTQRRAGSSSTVGGSSSHLGDHHLLLSAVLLRRDILRLTNAYVLQEMVPPLLALFTDTTEWNHTNLRRQVGHCLTAICQTLTLLNHNSECDAIMNTVFNQIISLVRKLSLKILLKHNETFPGYLFSRYVFIVMSLFWSTPLFMIVHSSIGYSIDSVGCQFGRLDSTILSTYRGRSNDPSTDADDNVISWPKSTKRPTPPCSHRDARLCCHCNQYRQPELDDLTSILHTPTHQ